MVFSVLIGLSTLTETTMSPLMKSLNTVLSISLLVSLIGCVSTSQEPVSDNVEIIPEPVPVAIVKLRDAEPAVDWVEVNNSVVKYEDGYRHVIVTEAVGFPVTVAAVTPVTPAAAVTKEKNVQLISEIAHTLPVVLADNSPNEEALLRALAAADDIDAIERSKSQENKTNKAWSKYCLHGALTSEESHIIETTKMPEYLETDCIPHK